MTCGHHDKIAAIRRFEHFEEVLSVFDLVVLMGLSGHTHNVGCSEARKAALCSCVCSMKLGPSFFKQTDPELTVPASRERWFPIRLNREVIINNNWRVLPVQEEFHHVDARSIDFLRDKHGHDSARHFSQRAQSG